MINQGQYNDLTIYDNGIPRDSTGQLNCYKIIYFCLLIPNIIIIGIETLSSMAMLNVFSLLYCLFNILGILYSIAYVCYPRSKMARTKSCRVFIAIFMILSIITLVLVIVACLTVDFRDVDDWEDDYDQYYGLVIFLLIVIYLIPVIHCIVILLIRRTRLYIASQMNLVSINQANTYNNNQNVNLGNRYQPPNQVANQDNRPQVERVQAPSEQRQAPILNRYGQIPEPRPVQPASQQPRTNYQMHTNRPEPVPTPTHALPGNQLPGRMSNHPYINKDEEDAREESESLLSSFAQSRKSSTGEPYRPGIN